MAIDLDEKTAWALAPVQAKLALLGAGVSLAKNSQLHLTLAFLGEKSDSEVSQIIAKLRKIHSTPFQLSVQGVGLLPGDSFARVFYARLSSPPELLRLHQEIFSTLSLRQERAFLPHVTLARIRNQDNLNELVSLKKLASSEHFGTFQVNGFSLKRSVLGKGGATYADIASFELQ